MIASWLPWFPSTVVTRWSLAAIAMSDNPTKLTKRIIDLAGPRGRRYEIWDAELKGFGLRVEPSGLKSFILRYRPGGRRAAKRFVSPMAWCRCGTRSSGSGFKVRARASRRNASRHARIGLKGKVPITDLLLDG